jgi:inosose dehydratase
MAITIGAGSDAWGIWHAEHPAQIPWQRYLDEVAEAGYRVVEPGNYGYLPRQPVTVRAALAARGLIIPGGTYFAAMADRTRREAVFAGLDQTASWLAAIGARFLVLLDDFYRDPDTGMIRSPARLDEAGWADFVETIEALGRRARDAHGLALVFHPHCDATIETEADIERLLDSTDPSLVGLCMDTGHHVYSGGDPVAFWRKHHARMPYLHLKSMKPAMLETVRRENLPWGVAVARGVTEEPALGAVDFAGLAAALKETGYAGYAIVEQDMFPCDPAVPLPLARRTIAYLRQLGFTT